MLRIETVVAAAYGHSIRSLGRLPAPMIADHAAPVRNGQGHLLRAGGPVVGAVSLAPDGHALMADDLVVEPSLRGHGYGRVPVGHAEGVARGPGLEAVALYTNELMHENVAFYRKLGVVEADWRTGSGFARVFFRKELRRRSRSPRGRRPRPTS